jgi:hypothetical protein
MHLNLVRNHHVRYKLGAHGGRVLIMLILKKLG